MKKKKVILVIEASSTGFGIYGNDFPYTAYGNTIEEAKKDLESVVKEMLDYFKKEKKDPDPALNNGNLQFVYKYDIASIFEHFGVLDATQFAKKIGMNPSLLRQYKSGHALASDKQKQKIESGLHSLGRELLSVRL
jgi:ribosome-binding protein aMBF1 (putative translation factor)